VMRYKALAKRFRQALGVLDPIPAAMLLPEAVRTGKPAEPADPGKREFTSVQNLEGVVGKSQKAERRLDGGEPTEAKPESARNERETGGQEFASVQDLKGAREEAERLLAGCEGSCVSLMAALALRLSPDYAPRDEGGMRKAADRMADAKSWIAQERRRIARARVASAKARTG